MVDKARQMALKILYKIDKEGAYSNIVLSEMLNQNRNELNEKDIGLISQIVYGVTTWKLTLDEIIKKYSSIKLKKISPFILNILRMGIYQIIFLDKIPKSAAVNESVNLSKRYGHKGSSGFVNAILRKVTKNDYEDLLQKLNEETGIQKSDKATNIQKLDREANIQTISKVTSMPEWIVEELFNENLSEEKVKEICINSNKKPKLAIRVNTLKITKQKLIERLEKKGIGVEEGVLKDFLILNKVRDIENIEEFKEGLFTVQDEAAGLIAIVLEPKKNEKILDACSAPGGKTTYIAQIVENDAEIEAWDVHNHRTKLVEETAKRLGIDSIKTQVKDATIYEEKYFEKFDKILLDVPCLGIGVLKRKPDIKWQRKKEDIAEIIDIQYKILEVCSKYLKNGGDLVYSTCSIFKEENDKIISKFLEKHPNFYVKNIKLPLDAENENYFEKYLKNNFLKVYQNEETDGFFICKISKKM